MHRHAAYTTRIFDQNVCFSRIGVTVSSMFVGSAGQFCWLYSAARQVPLSLERVTCYSGLRVDGTDPNVGLFGPPSKGHLGVCAIYSQNHCTCWMRCQESGTLDLQRLELTLRRPERNGRVLEEEGSWVQLPKETIMSCPWQS